MHPASTNEQQSERKRFQAHGQLGDDSGTTVDPAVGRLRKPALLSRSGNVNQPGRSGGRRLAHRDRHALFIHHGTNIRDIRRQALHIGGYAVHYACSGRAKRWKVFVRLDREADHGVETEAEAWQSCVDIAIVARGFVLFSSVLDLPLTLPPGGKS